MTLEQPMVVEADVAAGDARAAGPAPFLAGPLRVVAMGGGTGLPRVLAGLAGGAAGGEGRAVELTAVVTVSDDGGSSGALRRAFGVPAPGDVRNCLVALADGASPLAGVFQHRFEGDAGLAGHTVGNLVLTALAQRLGDFGAAVAAVGALLGVRGRVIPATPGPAVLVAELRDGGEVLGESALAGPHAPIARVRLARPVDASPEVCEALRAADLVVLGPGSLYTSVIASALPRGVAAALAETSATRVLAVNLLPQPGETDGLGPAGHVRAVVRHLGEVLDVALLDRAAATPLERARIEALGVVPFTADLASALPGRHDPARLARALLALARVR